jgi:hypothetical protein
MNTSTGQCSLFLHPGQFNFTLKDLSPFIASLQKIGLLAQRINSSDDNNYFIGDRFLEYIAYMGCSPAIQFEASENKSEFCHVKIHHYESAKLIFSQQHSRAPLCPNCNKAVTNWHANKTESQIFCKQCNTTSHIDAFNWRKMAGYAQIFIEITDVFPKEAIPQQLLLNKLNEFFDVKWQYFYACQ